MSTRAVYTFKDKDSTYHVYKHHDNYPSEAYNFIRKALKKAWPLPRFEADEFACAFIAANKKSAGDVRLTTHHEDHGDLAYRYEITLHKDELYVTTYENTLEYGMRLLRDGDLRLL